ncbi:MAG: LCP family protein, partial [Acidimicrobiia bacterium]|nr:LCP family protein [Acidimicrobiia bacterium]
MKRAFSTLSILLLAITMGTAGLAAWWLKTGRMPIAAGATYMTVTKTASADSTPIPGIAPIFVLVVGSDARTGETVARGDAIHLVGVNPQSGQATMLDIPRDTGAQIPGHGTDKINAAMAIGGAQLIA